MLKAQVLGENNEVIAETSDFVTVDKIWDLIDKTVIASDVHYWKNKYEQEKKLSQEWQKVALEYQKCYAPDILDRYARNGDGEGKAYAKVCKRLAEIAEVE